jgi:hypothetical protein
MAFVCVARYRLLEHRQDLSRYTLFFEIDLDGWEGRDKLMLPVQHDKNMRVTSRMWTSPLTDYLGTGLHPKIVDIDGVKSPRMPTYRAFKGQGLWHLAARSIMLDVHSPPQFIRLSSC